MSKPRLNLVVVRCADIDKTHEFYMTLDLTFIKHSHGSGPEHFACELEQMVFELYPASKRNAPDVSTRLGFKVASLDATLKRLEDAGATMVSPAKDSPWGRRAVVSDTDGRRVELSE